MQTSEVMQMYNEICELLTMTQTVSGEGDPVETVSAAKSVFCRIYSADEKEKTYAVTRGRKAELVIELSDRIDYNDELFVRWNGKVYEVVDTKWGDTSNKIKLVVSRWAYR